MSNSTENVPFFEAKNTAFDIYEQTLATIFFVHYNLEVKEKVPPRERWSSRQRYKS